MPITNPTIQSWIEEFEENIGIEVTVEYINGELMMHTNEYYIDFYIDGEVVLEELGEIIREVVDPSFSVTSLPERPTHPVGWLIILVGVVATAVEMYQ